MIGNRLSHKMDVHVFAWLPKLYNADKNCLLFDMN